VLLKLAQYWVHKGGGLAEAITRHATKGKQSPEKVALLFSKLRRGKVKKGSPAAADHPLSRPLLREKKRVKVA